MQSDGGGSCVEVGQRSASGKAYREEAPARAVAIHLRRGSERQAARGAANEKQKEQRTSCVGSGERSARNTRAAGWRSGRADIVEADCRRAN